VLALKSVDYELVSVMPGAMDDDFRRKSPLAKIPVWEDGDFVLGDSSAICAYLEKKKPDPPVYPSQPEAFGRVLFWEEYGDTRLAESAGPIFFQRIVSAKVFGQTPDENIVRRHLEEVLPPVQDQLEEGFVSSGVAFGAARNPEQVERRGSQGGLQGVSVADIAVWCAFVNLEHSGVKLDSARWPGLAAFLDAMNEQPALARILEEEKASLSSR
jgi:glutathione S-transferase